MIGKKNQFAPLDDFSAAPKYVQLRERLEAVIRGGDYAVGDKLCTEADLKSRYGLSTATVTRALADLERRGLVTRRKGAGTFVAARHAPPRQSSFGDRTLLICGMPAHPDLKRTDTSWFVTYEIHRGLINSFEGRVRLIGYPELSGELDGLPPAASSLIMLDPPESAVQQARRAKLPWVVMRPFGVVGQVPANTVTIDRLRGVVDGMTYLLQQLGHRAIALVIPPQDTPRHADRVAGYAIGLHTFGIPYNEKLVVHAPYGMAENGYAAILELRRRRVEFTAAFVSTDIKALGAMEALQQAGLHIPRDVSVLGFDDAPGAEHAQPPLTTIRVPRFELGVEAVAMLKRRLQSPDEEIPGVVLNSRLVIRGSCGPAPAG